jgi:D-3-phosphoglycerate dehydrogenase / 2-oxoglutarate reductase
MSLLVTARFEDAELARLEAAAGPARRAGYGVTGRRLGPAELAPLLADVDVLLVEYEQLTEAVLAGAPRLRLVGCCRNEPAASVDVRAASARGIPVLYTPARNAVAVAEYTLGLMLAAARRIAEAHHLLRYTTELTAVSYADKAGARQRITSEWSLEPGAPFVRLAGPELSGRTLGLIGFGTIGREIARRCMALGMDAIVFDPHVPRATVERAGARSAGLLETAAAADFLVLAAKVTPESTGLVSAAVLDALKSTAFFVNTARAALADYDALVEALRAGKLAGAALDVYPLEPLPPDSPLLELDNVVLSPHLAGASVDVPRHHSRQLADDVLRALRGERPLHLADPAVWDRRR